ncbi:MAG: SRPBCC family protein [Halobacteriota archaeon]
MRFATSTVVEDELDVVWSFHDRLDGVVALTPGWLDAEVRVLEGRNTPLAAGTRFELAVRPAGLTLPIAWRGRIVSVRRTPRWRSFVDVGEATPFRSWRHRHTLRAVEGGTEVLDEVRVGVPPVAVPFVRAGLAVAFADRRRRLRDRFGSPD